MKMPECSCFKPGETRGSAMTNAIASDVTHTFHQMCMLNGICRKAAYHVALANIATLLDFVAFSELDEQIKDKAEAHAFSIAAFERQTKTLVHDLREMREFMDAQMERDGATVQ